MERMWPSGIEMTLYSHIHTHTVNLANKEMQIKNHWMARMKR